jgi:hypothetical protein
VLRPSRAITESGKCPRGYLLTGGFFLHPENEVRIIRERTTDKNLFIFMNLSFCIAELKDIKYQYKEKPGKRPGFRR